MSNNAVFPASTSTKAIIFSLSGKTLTDQEHALFKEADPFGFILFARNCETPAQVKALTDDLKNTVGRNCPILIDQEGGRVQRLKPPHWREHPPLKNFGDMAVSSMEDALEQIRFRTLRIAEELLDCGINADCDPCLDLYVDDAHGVIGDRALSSDPDIIARLGLSICRHHLACGIQPIIKHIPGHGRALADSHDEVPIIDSTLEELRATDFVPFKKIAQSDIGQAVWAMPSPVLYPAVDDVHPACTSEKVIEEAIRKDIGFDGVLISDALDMGGFDEYGTPEKRALAVLNAGCDLALHCTGTFEEMEKIAESVPKLSEKARERLQNAEKFRKLAA